MAEEDSLSLSLSDGVGLSLEEMKGGGGAVVLDRELSNPWLHFHLSRPWLGCSSLYPPAKDIISRRQLDLCDNLLIINNDHMIIINLLLFMNTGIVFSTALGALGVVVL